MAIPLIIRRARVLRDEEESWLLLAGVVTLLLVALWGLSGLRAWSMDTTLGRVIPAPTRAFFAPQAWEFLHDAPRFVPGAAQWVVPQKPPAIKLDVPPNGELQTGNDVTVRRTEMDSPRLLPASQDQHYLIYHGTTIFPTTGIPEAMIGERRMVGGAMQAGTAAYYLPGATVAGLIIEDFAPDHLTVRLADGQHIIIPQGGRLEISH